ncbi:24605_t:CDS:2, partial [Gigaspora margarita]
MPRARIEKIHQPMLRLVKNKLELQCMTPNYIVTHKSIDNVRTLGAELMNKQVTSLLNRLNNKGQMGSITRTRILQGYRLAGIRKNIKEYNKEEVKTLERIWKFNLVALTFLRTEQNNIGFRANQEEWRLRGRGTPIRSFLQEELTIKCTRALMLLDVVYLEQLLNEQSDRLILGVNSNVQRYYQTKEEPQSGSERWIAAEKEGNKIKLSLAQLESIGSTQLEWKSQKEGKDVVFYTDSSLVKESSENRQICKQGISWIQVNASEEKAIQKEALNSKVKIYTNSAAAILGIEGSKEIRINREWLRQNNFNNDEMDKLAKKGRDLQILDVQQRRHSERAKKARQGETKSSRFKEKEGQSKEDCRLLGGKGEK